ncbi:hypothetical protein [Methanobrevibacter sp.]|uniref:hypothetical protein n=1 Tax=Methanobrevibacter sp. TaxID=66852 RepID=UPI00388D3CF7
MIVFVLALLIISAAVIFIDSSVDNINKTMPEISDLIVNGDKDYNEAVQLVNDRDFNNAMAKAEAAGNNYENSLSKLQDIKNEFSDDINDIQKEYIDTVINELNLKIQAVDKLKLSIENLQVYSNYTGSTYGSEANDLIYEAVQYQNERDSIVKDNPNLFK